MTVNHDFPVHVHDFAHDRWNIRRYKITLAFLEKHLEKGSMILDLGTVNGLGNFIAANGYAVRNTEGQDFDTDYKELKDLRYSNDWYEYRCGSTGTYVSCASCSHAKATKLIQKLSAPKENAKLTCPVDYREKKAIVEPPRFNAVTSFEIFEHLLNPFEVLRNLPADKLVASVPLRLWFATPYKNKTNPAGWHFHEMTDWQFFWLLEKAGWKVIDYEKHTSPSFTLGFRTILRWIVPRYFFAYCERT